MKKLNHDFASVVADIHRAVNAVMPANANQHERFAQFALVAVNSAFLTPEGVVKALREYVASTFELKFAYRMPR